MALMYVLLAALFILAGAANFPQVDNERGLGPFLAQCILAIGAVLSGLLFLSSL